MAKNSSKSGKGKVSFLNSLKGKVFLSTIATVVVVIIALMAITIPAAENSLADMSHNYLLDLAESYGGQLETAIVSTGTPDAILEPDNLANMFGKVGVEGISSSYAYIVSADGTMLYHPTASKIGQPVENAVVKGLVGDIAAGKNPGCAVTEYEFKGETKYASYYVPADNGFILVISADEKEILAPIENVRARGITFGILCVILAGILIFAELFFMMKPVEQMTRLVNKMQSLDFTESEEGKALQARKDEFGVMALAIVGLQKKLASTINTIRSHSSALFTSSEGMFNSASDMSETSEQVDKAVSEIAIGASSQASETQKATENVITIGNMIEEATQKVSELSDTASSMQESEKTASQILRQLGEVNVQTRDSIEEVSRQTETTNESATKIREVTALISEIAEETNLLSLNASIEAARAGEAGRGFAVVASQIQKLADQSSSSAKQIEEIVDKLIEDSNLSVTTMQQLREIIEKQSEGVDQTSEVFSDISAGIASSIAGIDMITDKMQAMDNARINVVDTVQNLTAIAEENAASTQESSASVSNITGIATNIEKSSGDLKSIAEDLDKNMSEFRY